MSETRQTEELVLWSQRSDLPTHFRKDGMGLMKGTDQHGRRVLFGGPQRTMDEFRKVLRQEGEILTRESEWDVCAVEDSSGADST